jgi:hypothetical protein
MDQKKLGNPAGEKEEKFKKIMLGIVVRASELLPA